MAIPHGPRPLSSQGQISLPKELLAAIGLRPGESALFVIENDDPPGTLLLIPAEMAEEWFGEGRRTSRRRPPA
jgi:bifunctional DNA-binding transcriptional regulator/antitoxin component of YhaV-PrlF toxin-antitoxin module